MTNNASDLDFWRFGVSDFLGENEVSRFFAGKNCQFEDWFAKRQLLLFEVTLYLRIMCVWKNIHFKRPNFLACKNAGTWATLVYRTRRNHKQRAPQCSCYSHRKPNHHKGYLATPSSSHLCYEFHHFYTFGPNHNPLRSVTTRQKFQAPVLFLVGPEPCELFKACRVHASLQFLDASVQKSKKRSNTDEYWTNTPKHVTKGGFLSQ